AATQSVACPLAPFEITVSGAGCFPPHGPPRVIWAGISGPPPELLDLQRRCEEAFAQLGYPPENRAYRPHLTLARTRDHGNARSVRAALKPFEHSSAGRFQVEELVLFQSIGGPSGHEHVPLMRAELGQTFA